MPTRRFILNPAATRGSIGFQPLSQVLQEFEPMARLRAQIHALLAPDGGRVHGVFRPSRAARPAPAPRWTLQTRLAPA